MGKRFHEHGHSWHEVYIADFTKKDAEMFNEGYKRFLEKRGLKPYHYGQFKWINDKRKREENLSNDKKTNHTMAGQKNST